MKHKNSFAGSCIDTDSDLRNILPNRYRYALNCLNNNTDGENGSITNRKGNTLINFVLPTGNNKVVGSKADIERNAVVYFVYNDIQNHSILRYNIKQRTIDKIVWSNKYLNFQADRYITSIDVVGDLLYWTDGWFNKFTYDDTSLTDFKNSGFNPPRKINMVKAYNYTNGVVCADSMKYTAITQEVMDRIKYPPVKPIDTKFVNDPTVATFNLQGKEYQFAHRYTYDDNEKSVISPYSTIAHSTNQYDIYGHTTIGLSAENAIKISVYNGSEIVKNIEIFARDSETSDWYLVKTIENYDEHGMILPANIPYSLIDYNFTGNELFLPVDQADLIRPFDFIGQVVDQSTIITENHIIDGGVTENYDNVNLEVALEWIIKDVPVNSSLLYFQGQYFNFYPSGGGIDSHAELFLNFSQFNLNPQAPLYGQAIIISFYITGFTTGHIVRQYAFTYFVTQSDTISYSIFRTNFITALHAWVLNVRRSYHIQGVEYFDLVDQLSNSGDIYLIINYNTDIGGEQFGGGNVNFYALSIFADKGIGFKQGFTHDFGIVYYDRALRSGGVNIKDGTQQDSVSGGTSLYVPFVTEIPAHQGVPFPELKYFPVKWTIWNRPPDWATHYQWVYKKNTPKYLQFYFTSASINAEQNLEIADLNTNIGDFARYHPNTHITYYTWQKGDRMRFIGRRNWFQTGTFYYSAFLDIEILGQLTGGNVIMPDFQFQNYQTLPLNTYDYVIVEIYSQPSQTSEFYEIGEQFEVLSPHTPNRCHQGSVVGGNDQDILGTPARGTFVFGNTYTRLRYTQGVQWFGVESNQYSDYYLGVENNYGRVNTVIPNIKRQKYNTIRWSERYLPNTQINGFSTFPFLNKEDMSDIFGQIYGIREVGQTLKVLQEKKNTSFYVGIQELSTAIGGNIPVVSSDKLFGKANPSELSYGTKNPESVVVSTRHLYFYDINSGEIIRDAANGMFALGKYDLLSGVKNWLNDKQEELLNADSYSVITSLNAKYNEVWFTFISTRKGITVCDTIVYNEMAEKFTTFMGYYIELVQNTKTVIKPLDYFGYNGQNMVAFLDGQLWLENDNNEYNKIFGYQRQMIVSPVVNADQEKVKIFLSTGLSTNNNTYNANNDTENWSAEITIPATDTNVTGQKTTIPAKFFKLKEEALYSEIPRNIKSKMTGSDLYKMVNGDVMRGQVAEIKLINSSSKKVELYSVITNYVNSEKSK